MGIFLPVASFTKINLLSYKQGRNRGGQGGLQRWSDKKLHDLASYVTGHPVMQWAIPLHCQASAGCHPVTQPD